MARRQRSKPGSNSQSGVKGPNSALTEFLRNEGITDAFRQRRQREQEIVTNNDNDNENDNDINEQEQFTPSVEVTPEATSRGSRRSASISVQEDEDDDEIREMRRAAKRKLRASRRGSTRQNRHRHDPNNSSDDDSSSSDNDGDPNFSEDEDDLGNANMRKFGEQDDCVDCGQTFELTVSSRFIKEKNGYLCNSCNQLLKARERKAKMNQMNARKKRKRVAQALLNKTDVRIPKLQDVCIKKITENIEDVDVLGDIGQMNMNRISMILSKNRSLNDKTISLFLSPDLKSLQFWDCSNVASDSLNKIASYCPQLESLTLFMCGQFHNDNLQYFASQLTKLTELSLNGPFLISDVMWQDYFEEAGSRLTKFEVRNTHRFGNDSLISLLTNAGRNLTSLKLSRLDGLNAADVYGMIPHFLSPSKLTHLEISYPESEELINDDLIISILSITGDTLVSLNLDGCSDLTEKFLIDGIAQFCPNLTHLSIQNLDQISDEGFAQAFKEYSKVNVGGLLEVYLTKCIGLGDKAIYELLKHSGHTLVELSINSLDLLTKDFLSQVFTEDSHQFKKRLLQQMEESQEKDVEYYNHIKLPLLTYLDSGFVRAIDNELLFLIGESCPQLKIIEVYGDNRCTSKARIRPGLMVIGRQSDEI
ncbi:DNA repair protein, putative [Candida dubliniensis CD36]|uniref:DNA repair protein, putative n=1 Tax=Candida dubliniensis (strain CD36 / ATCC MYA-646 / CBS 7987 / NCPF 3949 / NRRL Y-17841) TaxID=573826 RepID=B9WAM6_CANDC|nr:DNA repair protein, putative [Candida dubliniensis CD36]CAX43446.1 DNA repair protein, putative [Candida dubliniensis CD36]